MTYTRQMLDTYPRTVEVDLDTLAAAIEVMNECAQVCTEDVDADLGVSNLAEMVKCIRLCLHCADVCTAAARITGRVAEYETDITRPLLDSCVAACKACGDECERHAHMHEHCRICAEVCRRCEDACRHLLAALK
jgi:hypothetical protein